MQAEPLIVAVIRRYAPAWPAPQDTGRTWLKATCPWHGDDRASAGVSYEHNAFTCHGCGVKGDAVSIIRRFEEVDYRTAVEIAASLSPGSDNPIPRKPEPATGSPGGRSPRQSRRRLSTDPWAVPGEPSGSEVPARAGRRSGFWP